jgi:hypothetical protein
MRIAFLTEMGFIGKVPANHSNMRTEFAWMHALDADHHNIHNLHDVIGYDAVVVIFPKGKVYLSAEGTRLINQPNPVSELLAKDIVATLKVVNKKVLYMQEGPHWWFNDYELVDQINFYNMIASCDGILVHNESDKKYYNGMFPDKPVNCMPTLMIDDIVKHITPQPEDKAIIGGNFARWYGGFESYIVAQEFNVPIWGQTSHATRDGEHQLINQLPRVLWSDWMEQLSSFKYAIHLMPTVAAGTFSLNCAYFGIPCIGNKSVDTQMTCHPWLSVDVSDIDGARKLAKRLVEDEDFYQACSIEAKENYQTFYNQELFKQTILSILK